MKYKVIYLQSGSGKSGMANAEFYKKATAVTSAETWRELGGDRYAYLFDGSSWTAYDPIP